MLRRAGYLAAVVERWIPGANVRSDLWHFGDVLAVHESRREYLIVQVTTAPNVAARLAKAKGRPELASWLRAGGRFEVHGWAKRRERWYARRVEVSAGELAVTELQAIPRARRRRRNERQGELF